MGGAGQLPAASVVALGHGSNFDLDMEARGMGPQPPWGPMAGTDIGPYGSSRNSSRLVGVPPGFPPGPHAHCGPAFEWGRPGLDDPGSGAGAEIVAGDGAGQGAGGAADRAGVWAGGGRVSGAGAGDGLACGGCGGAGATLARGAGGMWKEGDVGPTGEVEVVVSGGGSDGGYAVAGAARAGRGSAG